MDTPRIVDASEVVVTRSGDPEGGAPGREHAALDVAEARFALVVPASRLARMTPGERSTAAGLAGVPVDVVEALARAGLPLPVAAGHTAAAVRDRARDIAAEHGFAVEVVRPAGWIGPLLAVVVGMAGVVVALGAWLAGLTAVWIGALVVSVLLVLGVTLRWFGRRAAHARLTDGARHASAARVTDPELTPLWDRIAGLRVQLARADLPDAAAVDLRGALDDAEDHLRALARVREAARQPLGDVDIDALNARLSALGNTPDDAAERERLQGTLADLEAIRSRTEGARDDAARLATSLDELAAVLGRLHEAGDPDRVVAQLARTTRLTRETLVDTGTRRPGRERELP